MGPDRSVAVRTSARRCSLHHPWSHFVPFYRATLYHPCIGLSRFVRWESGWQFPRGDDEWCDVFYFLRVASERLFDNIARLERELAASKAEVARLKAVARVERAV